MMMMRCPFALLCRFTSMIDIGFVTGDVIVETSTESVDEVMNRSEKKKINLISAVAVD